jgi:hypothetical protein
MFIKWMGDDPEFNAAIIAANPEWNLLSRRLRGTSASRRLHLINEAKAGVPKPTLAHQDYQVYIKWLKKDAGFKAAILSANPAWALVGMNRKTREEVNADWRARWANRKKNGPRPPHDDA